MKMQCENSHASLSHDWGHFRDRSLSKKLVILLGILDDAKIFIFEFLQDRYVAFTEEFAR
jgi:hypothetical protein